MTLLKKLWTGGPNNRTRLHDEKGQIVPLARGLVDAPRSLASWLKSRTTGTGPELPWFTYAAIRRLERLLRSSDHVVEYGSGMSTVWFSRRCAHITTIENAAIWRDKVSTQLAARVLKNATCLFEVDKQSYVESPFAHAVNCDVAVIDGFWRKDCLAKAIQHLSATPVLVVDDTDKDSGPGGGDMRQVEALVREYTRKQGLVWEKYTDFAPTSLFVKETSLIFHPSRLEAGA